jgi:hypothetical protein
MVPSLPLSINPSGRRTSCKVIGVGQINACSAAMETADFTNVPYAWNPGVPVVVCRHCGVDVTAAQTAESWALVLAPATPALPSQPSALDELLAAARYAAEYLSPAPPTEGKPMKAGVILRAAIRRYEAQR